MKLLKYILFFLFISCLQCTEAQQKSTFTNFVTVSGDKLMDGEKEIRFISYNIPNLHYIEDNMPFTEPNPWRLPDYFEVTDALTAVKQSGGQVVRTYTLSVRVPDENKDIPRHVLGPGEFNEEAFRSLDKVLHMANKIGVRVIIPFVDNWTWWGGRGEYAAFRGKSKDDFWTNQQIIADFKETIKYVVNRRNVYTGVKYKDDKAILGWETGNELQCPHSWTHQIAEYVKSIDPNHIVIDGYHASDLRAESINDPFVDVVTTHHYSKSGDTMVEKIKKNRAMAKGKKPYFVGEFGFVDTPSVQKVLDTVIANGTSGALIWSLRFRSRDGGFYWHSEPYGGDLFKAYLWPGFATGDPYDEVNLFKLMQQKASEITGLPIPETEIPQAPVLLPIKEVGAISWQGSVGSASYDVERAENTDGPWKVVGKGIVETVNQYRPLFNDESVEVGKSYYYRIRAKNEAGTSTPSNIQGPIRVQYITFIDELHNFSKIHTYSGDLAIESKEARKFKEDLHRLAGGSGDAIVYRVPRNIRSVKVFAFFEDKIESFIFSVSADGSTYNEIENAMVNYYSGTGAYGYWKPILFFNDAANVERNFLKVEFKGKAQISRIEVTYE